MPERSSIDDASSLRGERVLVVEDEYMLAQDLREDLERRGAAVMGPVPTVAEALELLGRDPAPSMAILDINLQGEMSYPVAEVLRATGIPFLFATGYEPWAIPDGYADVPRAEKPIELGQVLQMLRR